MDLDDLERRYKPPSATSDVRILDRGVKNAISDFKSRPVSRPAQLREGWRIRFEIGLTPARAVDEGRGPVIRHSDAPYCSLANRMEREKEVFSSILLHCCTGPCSLRSKRLCSYTPKLMSAIGHERSSHRSAASSVSAFRAVAYWLEQWTSPPLRRRRSNTLIASRVVHPCREVTCPLRAS